MSYPIVFYCYHVLQNNTVDNKISPTCGFVHKEKPGMSRVLLYIKVLSDAWNGNHFIGIRGVIYPIDVKSEEVIKISSVTFQVANNG